METGHLGFVTEHVLPAGAMDRIDADERKVFVERSKDEIKGAPEYDPDRWERGEDREEVARHFSSPFGA